MNMCELWEVGGYFIMALKESYGKRIQMWVICVNGSSKSPNGKKTTKNGQVSIHKFLTLF